MRITFLLPNLRLYGGIKSSFAMANAVGAVPDLITDGSDALVCAPRDIGRLTQSILDLLIDADLHDRLQNDVRRKARQLIGRAAEQFENVISEVTGKSL
ncbi:MAG: hypothetical protein U5O39_15855 [Gammaproteobacteria bacterium]|nr:hypothetical protein [Gammaproteobacteria bacterium]